MDPTPHWKSPAYKRDYYAKNKARILELARADYARNPDKYKSKTLKTKFGITLAEFDAISEFQAGLCAVCCEPLPRGKACHVDHDHQTGAVRGLLCTNCNVGIGNLRDDAIRCASAAAYLGAF
jgi:hypothetical protein